MKKTILFAFASLLLLIVGLSNCSDDKKPTPTVPVTGTTYHPVQMPSSSPNIPGWKFPEDSTLINKWVATNDLAAIYKHSWGVWDALTSPSKELYNKEKLLVFETWYTPEDVQDIILGADTTKGRARANFQPLHQIQHQSASTEARSALGFVKWSPGSADHIMKNKLLYKSVLDKMQQTLDGKQAKMIAEFPNNSVALKPVFMPIQSFPQVKPGVYQFDVWPGPPDTPKAYGSTTWKNYAFIDSNNPGATQNTATTKDPLKFDPAATYGLGDFIYFKMDSLMAAQFNSDTLGNAVRDPLAGTYVAKAGDIFVLLAMHITTKEIKRWTWQSMYWTPTPNQPVAPSGNEIVAQRPSQFQTPAAGRYAMTVAYSMVNPAQPYSGGSGEKATSIYAYNPYLEASFGPDVLPLSTKVGKTLNNFGVQTNCMSCHAYASYPGIINNNPNNPYYTADRYVDMFQDTVFTRLKNLQVDFLWSVQANVLTNK